MSVLPQNTVAALTTPPGPGAIAVIELHGPGSRDALRAVFRPGGRSLAAEHPLQLVYGSVHRNGMVIDDVVARWVPPEHSFTGMDSVEIHAHGGSAPAEAIFHLLEQYAVTRVPWPALVDLAYGNKKIDAMQAEAWRLLSAAPTPLAAATLQDQARGALSRAVRDVRTVDDVDRLLETADLGCAIACPPRIVIAGRPNVGKSTLFNALLEAERALVTPEAGTTRDPVTAMTAMDGVPMLLVDTAGIHPPKDPLDAESMERTREEVMHAALVMVVIESGMKPDEQERAFVGSLGLRPHVMVSNKCDLAGAAEGWPVSALCGTGLAELRRAMLDRLGLRPRYRPGAPAVFTHRQKEGLLACRSDLRGRDRLFVFSDAPKA